MIEITERAGGYLKWSSMADNASFGLEYLLLGETGVETNELLQEGIKFCDMLEKGADQTNINTSKIEACLAVSSLTSSFDVPSGEVDKRLEEIVKEAKIIKESLIDAITENKTFSKEEIRKMQRFFNEVSTPYLNKAFKEIRQSEMVRSKSRNVYFRRTSTC